MAARDVAQADDAFGADLYRLLGAGGGNLVFSPASIAAALRMALAGARGATAAQLASVLHLTGPEQAGVGLRALAARIGAAGTRAVAEGAGAEGRGAAGTGAGAEGRGAAGTGPGAEGMGGAGGPGPGPGMTVRAPVTLWIQAGLPVAPEFTTALGPLADAVHDVDFAGAPERARQEVNAVIAEQTAGRIAQLLGPGSVRLATRLVLASAVYLKAAWEHPFPPGATTGAPFHPAAGTDVEVPMMRVAARLGYLRGDGYQAVILPYVGGQLAMAVVVPDGPLAPLEERLADGVGSLLAGAEPTQVRLGLPRFRHLAAFGLTGALADLGATVALGHEADFTGITPAGGLFLSEVAHQAFIDVNEHGTEAAAATSVAVALVAYARPERFADVTVDRPFLFAVTDMPTGLPLFLGRVAMPSGQPGAGLGH